VRPTPPAHGRAALGRRPERAALGDLGEQVAVEHLRRRGYDVLARNVRTPRGEIDLIARHGATLAFVEIKTRRVSARQQRIRPDQDPLLGLGAGQQARLRRLAAAWLRDTRARPYSRAAAIRFDAIGVVVDTRGELRRIEHVEGGW
jgi:putative endonuclease